MHRRFKRRNLGSGGEWSGAITHIGLRYLLVEVTSLTPLVATCLAFIWVVIQSYWLNHNWTFKSVASHQRALPRYIAATGLGFISNLALMYILTIQLGLWYIAAQALTALFIPLSNYLLSKYWAFA